MKIASGDRHCLAVSEKGSLFGWGYNNMMQLSNADDFQDAENPSHAIFEPEQMGGELTNKFVVDVAAGSEHSVAVCQIRNSSGKCTHELVYSCGNNLKRSTGCLGYMSPNPQASSNDGQ